MARPKGAKNAKRKKVAVDEDNVLDPVRDPTISYAITNSPSKTLAYTIKETPEKPITDEELKNLLAKPDWIWAGMLGPVLRIFARLEQYEKRQNGSGLLD